MSTIASVGVTTGMLTSRGGLTLFGRFIEGIGMRPILKRLFESMRKNGKGFQQPNWPILEGKSSSK